MYVEVCMCVHAHTLDPTTGPGSFTESIGPDSIISVAAKSRQKPIKRWHSAQFPRAPSLHDSHCRSACCPLS